MEISTAIHFNENVVKGYIIGGAGRRGPGADKLNGVGSGSRANSAHRERDDVCARREIRPKTTGSIPNTVLEQHEDVVIAKARGDIGDRHLTKIELETKSEDRIGCYLGGSRTG